MSDTAIRAALRTVLHRNHIETSPLRCGSFRGVVRIAGPARTMHTHKFPTAEVLEAVERDVRAIRGVKRVDLQLDNMRRDDEGMWKPVRTEAVAQASETVSLTE